MTQPQKKITEKKLYNSIVSAILGALLMGVILLVFGYWSLVIENPIFPEQMKRFEELVNERMITEVDFRSFIEGVPLKNRLQSEVINEVTITTLTRLLQRQATRRRLRKDTPYIIARWDVEYTLNGIPGKLTSEKTLVPDQLGREVGVLQMIQLAGIIKKRVK